MMKLVGIVGSISEKSYNRKLLQFMANNYKNLADIEVLEIKDVPMFETGVEPNEAVQYLNNRIKDADGVILATPEHNHTTSPALKSVIEWLSSALHPFIDKPVLLVGASTTKQGSSRAQLDLRQILESPGVNALVMPKDEFLLSNAHEAFDEDGNLKDERTVGFLGTVVKDFIQWVNVLNAMQKNNNIKGDWKSEDLSASQGTDTTINGVDMEDPNWVEKAAEKTNAAEGKDYVKLDRGVLSVDQLNWFLTTMPMELTFADDNNQFLYYNRTTDNGPSMLAPRDPSQAGSSMDSVHPDRAKVGVKHVIHQLRTRETDLVQMPVPGNKINEKHIMHYYKGMYDENGKYRGVNEWVLDLWPIVKSYLEMTGQKLVKDENAPDVTSGASNKSASKMPVMPKSESVDAVSGASNDDSVPHLPVKEDPVPTSQPEVNPYSLEAVVDATSGASEDEVAEEPKQDYPIEENQTDATSGASEE